MTGASALQLTSHAAVIVGAVILWLYKDLEQSDLPDRRVMHVGWNVTVGIARMRPHEIVETAG